MAEIRESIKQSMINKANSTVVIATSAACFIVIFCAVASVTLFSQFNYQNRIIGAKKTALNQLKDNIEAVNTLKTSYDAFVHTSQNIIGGNPLGNGSQDGDNAKIILDALPSSYDFPALATSLEKILTSQKVKIVSINGTDDSLNQQENQTSSQPSPQAIPFTLSASGDYKTIQRVINTFQSSIRPFKIQTVQISGDQGDLTLTLGAETYYQPAKALKINKEVIK